MEETPENVHTTKTCHSLRFSEIDAPGCYVGSASGDLYRVPEDGVLAGRSPVIDIVARTPRMVTKISQNPWLPISEARRLAVDSDLHVNF